MKLTNFNKTHLKNYTYLELMLTIGERLTAVIIATVTNQKAQAAINAFKSAVAAMDAAYKSATTSPLTQPLADADLARDRAYGSLSQVVSAMLTSGVQTLETAAAEIQSVLSTFKVNTGAQYNEESGALLQLCQELDNHTAALTTLNLTAVYAELKTQNEQVRTILKQRNEAQAQDQTAVMKTHRANVDAAYSTMLDHINAVLCLDTNTTLEQAISVINQDIKYVCDHNGISTAKATADPTDPTPTDPSDTTPDPTPTDPDPSTPDPITPDENGEIVV